MKLSECTYGRMVITNDKRVGFVMGLTYNVHLRYTANLSPQELLDRTVPVVKFVDGEQPIHPANLMAFE